MVLAFQNAGGLPRFFEILLSLDADSDPYGKTQTLVLMGSLQHPKVHGTQPSSAVICLSLELGAAFAAYPGFFVSACPSVV
jgi:hypothetical protein